jgi:NADH-quinone oxidoreductase subunit J
MAALIVLSGYFSGDRYSLTAHAADYSNTKELGSVLYTFYVYPFEIASVILLVAIVAAISLTMRRREGVKSQNPGEQVRVSRDDRVRLVRLAPEKKN